jgi:hypothetical protein
MRGAHVIVHQVERMTHTLCGMRLNGFLRHKLIASVPAAKACSGDDEPARSPAVGFLISAVFTYTAPNCCYWRVSVLLPTQASLPLR